MKRRITTAVIGAVALALVFAGLGTVALTNAGSERAAQDELRRRAVGISEIVVGFADQGRQRPELRRGPGSEPDRDPDLGRPRRLPRTALDRMQDAFQVQDIGLTILDDDEDPRRQLNPAIDWTDGDVAQLLSGGDVVGRTVDGEVFAAVGRHVGRETVVVTLVGEDASLFGESAWWFLVTSAFVLAVAVVIATRLGTRLAEPIRNATDVTSRIATGDLSARLPPPPESAHDESSVLSRSINSMADALERSRGVEQQFLLSVSHDLRTPLTSIKGYAEAISDGTADDPQVAATVISAETRRMERLVQDLLDLARLDAHQFAMHSAPVDIAELVAAAAASLRPEVERAGLTLDSRVRSSAVVLVDSDRVTQVLGNIVGNAVRFARSTVILDVGVDDGSALVSVTDDGPGIAPADLPHVFERLYQSSHQPVRQESGTGLGLAIVRELIAAMGGEVGVASPATGGTTVWFRVPIVAR